MPLRVIVAWFGCHRARRVVQGGHELARGDGAERLPWCALLRDAAWRAASWLGHGAAWHDARARK
eukprot:4005194-Pleurochrysis_carterae.AAC.1